MKTRIGMSFHGEPSKTTRRNGLTDHKSVNANLMFHLKLKSHSQLNLHDEFEQEEKLLMSMENAAGIVVCRPLTTVDGNSAHVL